MALIDELKQLRAEHVEKEARALDDYKYFVARIIDFDTAIAALEPAPAEPEEERELPSDEWYVTADQTEEAPVTLGPPNAFLNSILERGGTWHDGGDNPAPDWFCDIYVPAGAGFENDVHELEGQPSNAYVWKGWEVAYVKTQPMYDETHTDDLRTAEGESGLHVWTAEELEQLSAKADAFIAENGLPQIDPKPSVMDDPELQAAVARAEATLAAEPTDETRYPTADEQAIFTSALFKSAKRIDEPAEPAAYVGLNDPELDEAWDEMKRREAAERQPEKVSDSSYWLSWKRKREDA